MKVCYSKKVKVVRFMLIEKYMNEVTKMSVKVMLQDIIEGMEMQIEESSTYLNMKTGEIITVSLEALRDAEDDEPFDHLTDWEQEERKAAIDIVENDENYQELPTKYEINEYKFMEDFSFSIHDKKIQDLLFSSIKGKGAFRRFKDNLIKWNLTDQWYSYRDERLKQIAIEWCKYNNINFTE